MTRNEYDSLIGHGNEIIRIFDGLCERYEYGGGRYVCCICHYEFPDSQLLLRDLEAPDSEICDAIDMGLVEDVHEMASFIFLYLLFQTGGEAMTYFYIDDCSNLCLDTYNRSLFSPAVTELILRAFVEGGYNFSFDDGLYVFSGFSGYGEMVEFMMKRIYSLITIAFSD